MASHNDRIYAISDGHPTGLDTVFDVAGDTVTLTKPITGLIFFEGEPAAQRRRSGLGPPEAVTASGLQPAE